MKAFAVLLICVINLFLVHAATDKIICYYGSWAHYRSGNGKVSATDLNPNLCTHIIYSFVGITGTGGVQILDDWLDISLGGIRNTVALKNVNPKLKVMVAIGGWNQGGTRFSAVAESPSLRAAFVQNVLNFISQHSLDGFDIDWEYPGSNGGRPQDKQNYVLLIKALREAFDQRGYILSAAVGAPRSIREQAYDVPSLNKYLHFINLMTYDIHASWDGRTGQNAPLYASSIDTNTDLNVNVIVNQWIQAGATPSRLVLGLGLYGRSFTLASSSNHGLGASTTGAGNPGPITAEGGVLSYLEVCTNVRNGWTVVYDSQQEVPYAYQGNQWVGYDNVQSINKKVDFARSNGLGGVMVWSLEQDDIRNVCGGGAWTLLTAIKNRL